MSVTSKYWHIAVTSRSKATEGERTQGSCFSLYPSVSFWVICQVPPTLTFLASFFLLSFLHKPHLFVANSTDEEPFVFPLRFPFHLCPPTWAIRILQQLSVRLWFWSQGQFHHLLCLDLGHFGLKGLDLDYRAVVVIRLVHTGSMPHAFIGLQSEPTSKLLLEVHEESLEPVWSLGPHGFSGSQKSGFIISPFKGRMDDDKATI